MQIIFESIKIKNLMSFGNSPTLFHYKNGINVVTGVIEGDTKRNGIGKSVLCADALSIGLYGKPLRGENHIKKEDLVNKVNGKNCEVEVCFKIDEISYRVIRRIKPNELVVYQDEKEIKYDSMKHTQEWLENKLGFSHTCFKNLIVLNTNNSKPFFSMDAKEKRQVMEDILSMNVYGRMSEIAKNTYLGLKGDKTVAENELKNALSNLDIAKENRKSILEESKKFETEKKKRCKDIEKEIKNLKTELDKVKNKIKDKDYDEEIKSLKEKRSNIDKKIVILHKKESELSKSIKDCDATLSILEHAPHCPTCHSPTKGELVQKFIKETKDNKDNYKKETIDITDKIKNGEYKKTKLNDQIKLIQNERDNNIDNNNRVNELTNHIDILVKNLKHEQERQLNINDVVSEESIEEYKNKIKNNECKYENICEDLKYNNIFRSILGDDGIRRFVIAKILPFLNKKVNDYLKTMGCDYSLIFNESLEEKIITRNRDERTYENFSSGEKKRIDLAVLLSLMDLAKLQNSVDTNILILDEVLDSAMDSDGVEAFLDYLNTKFKKLHPNKSIYIITHRKDIDVESFDRLIYLVKSKGFTRVEKIVDQKNS